MLVEPVTSITDGILSVLALSIAGRLLHNAPHPLARRDVFWASGFAALAVASALGAAVHGFSLEPARESTWTAICAWTIISEIFFVLAAVSTVFGDRVDWRTTTGILFAFTALLLVL